MVIDVYNGISREEIAAQRVTSEGKVYSLFHSRRNISLLPLIFSNSLKA